MNKFFRKEVLIGFVVILAMTILFIGIEFLKGDNVFKATNYYYATFDNVAGLANNAPVTINGFKVGLVQDIEIDYSHPDKVKVEMSLDKELRVPAGSKALLTSDLLGTASIVLQLAVNDSFHEVGDELVGEVPKGMLDNVSTELLPSLSAIFPKVDTLLTTINRLVADPAISNSIKRLDAITADLTSTTRKLDGLVANLQPITDDVKVITGNFSEASARINDQMNAMQLDSIAGNIQSLTANLNELSEELKNPDSTLGLLTKDPALYNNLNSAVSDLDSLFKDIKQNPKRYINIKLL